MTLSMLLLYMYDVHCIYISLSLFQSQLYAETTPACVEEEDVLSDSISKCSLCLSSKNVSIPPHLSLDGKKEEYTSSLLFHSGQSYHSTCANFWLNVVQEELPVLL